MWIYKSEYKCNLRNNGCCVPEINTNGTYILTLGIVSFRFFFLPISLPPFLSFFLSSFLYLPLFWADRQTHSSLVSFRLQFNSQLELCCLSWKTSNRGHNGGCERERRRINRLVVDTSCKIDLPQRRDRAASVTIINLTVLIASTANSLKL
jgi:hypothetical protein